MEPFDITAPLPNGTTLLEASAGTGKTWTLARLVRRYIAEGHATLDQLLIVTFGRAATQELRERVRADLIEAVVTLTDPDQLRRVRDALAAFDAATIATTHQFCQIVLRSLGVAGDSDTSSTLVDSVDDLLVEVVDDLYLQRFGGSKEAPPFTRDVALMISRAVVGDSRAEIVDGTEGPVEAARVDFARSVRAELDLRKRRGGLLSYDDLLSRLADALESPDSPARLRMRERWKVVLVDEFQDTDPVQWQVLDRAFSGHSDLILIGDPKQAIYGFRGGDVATYLQAARTANQAFTLGINQRSDAALVSSVHRVLEGAELGDPRITVLPVAAAEHRSEGRLLNGGPPWRMRQVRRDTVRTVRGQIPAQAAREFVAADCAADIARLLSGPAQWQQANPDGRGTTSRPLQARDIAVVVGRRDHGLLVQAELTARGVPAVVAGGGDVFHTEAADAWLSVLEAAEAPHRTLSVRAAAMTPFFGYRAAELTASPVSGLGAEAPRGDEASSGDQVTARVADALRGWASLIRQRGVAAVLEAAEEFRLAERVLATEQGDRLLTDLRHLGQLLHERQVSQRWGLTGLLEWFRRERQRVSASERPRRLDSDSAAVQIVTTWGSKGLQYPVVYLPFAYDKWIQDRPEVVNFHASNPDGTSVRSIDVSGSRARVAEHIAEEVAEELRVLYVSLTRAQSQVVTWWAPTMNSRHSGLTRLVLGRQPGVAEVRSAFEPRDDDWVSGVFGQLEQLGGPHHEWADLTADELPFVAAPSAQLAARTFDRSIDWEWRRTSYSGLIRSAEEIATALGQGEAPSRAGVGSEAERLGLKDDEPAEPETAAEAVVVELPDASDPWSARSPMADLPAGAGFGSLVHAVLETADPQADDLQAELRSKAGEQLKWWPAETTSEDLAVGLLPMNLTPLGPLASQLTLSQISQADRLCELDFEIPLAGGGSASDDVWLRDFAPVLRRHLSSDDPLWKYADELEREALGGQSLRGFLSGSIDVVLRIPDPAVPEGRFVIADYKTNFLGHALGDYAPARLGEAMMRSHYPLQALLYGVVLHRYLRWRLPGYEPNKHLGGVLYLYVRGMAGPQTPTVDGVPAGVFSWAPPAAMVVELSAVIDADQSSREVGQR